MKQNKPIIEINNLAKRYDDDAGVYDALKKVNLTVLEGDFLAIM